MLEYSFNHAIARFAKRLVPQLLSTMHASMHLLARPQTLPSKCYSLAQVNGISDALLSVALVRNMCQVTTFRKVTLREWIQLR
jgi:hypothetical protein